MSPKVRTLLIVAFVGLSIGVTACADATGPVLQDIGTSSYQLQDNDT